MMMNAYDTERFHCGDIVRNQRNQKTYRLSLVNHSKGTMRGSEVALDDSGRWHYTNANKHGGSVNLCPQFYHVVKSEE
mgnify:CR=1 FL=1